jgi:hypothetical protein
LNFEPYPALAFPAYCPGQDATLHIEGTLVLQESTSLQVEAFPIDEQFDR